MATSTISSPNMLERMYRIANKHLEGIEARIESSTEEGEVFFMRPADFNAFREIRRLEDQLATLDIAPQATLAPQETHVASAPQATLASQETRASQATLASEKTFAPEAIAVLQEKVRRDGDPMPSVLDELAELTKHEAQPSAQGFSAYELELISEMTCLMSHYFREAKLRENPDLEGELSTPYPPQEITKAEDFFTHNRRSRKPSTYGAQMIEHLNRRFPHLDRFLENEAMLGRKFPPGIKTLHKVLVPGNLSTQV